MNFYTKIPINKTSHSINYHSKMVFLGSCFAENMAEEFLYRKFKTLVNPFGIVFNPVSIAKILHNTVNHKEFDFNNLIFYNAVYQCFDVHSKNKNSDAKVLLEALNNIQNDFFEQLRTSTHVFITLGSAWVYEFKETEEIVANCHKIPQYKFKKRILSVLEIENSLKSIVDSLLICNSELSIIFTISPVRHIKDGFIENQQSKAHLFTALHQILKLNLDIEYFPSYELMIDELRDYRFYAEDMLHPNKTAISYIWQRLSETYMSKETCELMSEVENYQKMLAHKPFDTSTEAYQKFLVKIEEKRLYLSKIIHLTHT